MATGQLGRKSLRALIVANAPSEAASLRARLLGAGIDCPPHAVATPDNCHSIYAHLADSLDLVFAACDESHESYAATQLAQLALLGPADLIAVGQFRDARQVLHCIRAGASDYLHAGESFDEDLQAILTRMRGRRVSSGQLVSVVSVSGGCGASSVAVNLAAAAATREMACCLIDLNLSGGDLATMLNLTPAHTILDLCQQADELDAEMLSRSLAEHHCGLKLLACPPPLELAGPPQQELIQQVESLAMRMFPTVVVDLESVFHREQLATIRESHQVLIVLRLEFTCLVRLRRILEFLDQQGIARERLRLIVNRHGQKNELPHRRVVEALGQPVAHYLPEDYGISAMAANVGSPVVVESPHSRLGQAYHRLADAVLPLS